jgi:hypothetical protein
MWVIDWTITMLVAALIALLGFFIWDDARAERFSLRKDQWACTQSHNEVHFVMAAKTLIPTNQTVCTQWSRLEVTL